jgi:hypothetical protein
MTTWPRRREPDPGWPAPLRTFHEADWQEWLLDGPDPAAHAYVDIDAFYALPHEITEVCGWVDSEQRTRTVMVGIGDRPDLVAHWRRIDAHHRWREARRAWLKAHGLHDLALHNWIEDIQYERRVLRHQKAPRRDIEPTADT